MEENTLIEVMRNVSVVAAVIGVLAGIDLLTGARAIKMLRSWLDRTFNIDHLIIKVSSAIRKAVDRAVNLDETILQGQRRMLLGFVILVVSIGMIVVAFVTH